MTRRIILNGTVANDGTGDTLRTAAQKINDNFAEVYGAFGDGSSIALQPATRANLGGVIVGASMNVAANGLLSANIATDTGLGVVKVGSTLIISANGQIDADIPDSILDLGILDGVEGQALKTTGNGTFYFGNVTTNGGGTATNPFDQDLNTFNSVDFVSATAQEFYLDPAAAGVPTVKSDTSLYLTANSAANGVVVVTNTPFQLCSFTSSERDALIVTNGVLIYNETTNKFQGYAANTWVDLH
jgi:hypothetical protein